MNSQINCLIIDDEPLARDLIRKYIERIPFLNSVGECNNVIDALSVIKAYKIDLIFLDIQMPEIDGLTFLKTLIPYQADVIFTTAFSEYAIDGFESDVTDYLLKPITFERFLKGINKVLRRNSLKTELPGTIEEKTELTFEHDTFFEPSVVNRGEHDILLIKENKKFLKINKTEIIYVEGMKDYIKIHLACKKTIISHMTMLKIEGLLSAQNFIRINRSYIVNKSAIGHIDGNMLKTLSGEELIIGVNYREKIRNLLKSGSI